MKLHMGQRVFRKECPPECNQDECPRHVPVGTEGEVTENFSESWQWYNTTLAKNIRGRAWRIEWKDRGGYWTTDHCIDEDDVPDFPDGVWTDGAA